MKTKTIKKNKCKNYLSDMIGRCRNCKKYHEEFIKKLDLSSEIEHYGKAIGKIPQNLVSKQASIEFCKTALIQTCHKSYEKGYNDAVKSKNLTISILMKEIKNLEKK